MTSNTNITGEELIEKYPDQAEGVRKIRSMIDSMEEYNPGSGIYTVPDPIMGVMVETVPRCDNRPEVAKYRAGIFRILSRYMEEAANSSYRADNSELMSFIRDKNIFRDADEIWDLGAGPGDLVRVLAEEYPERRIRGFDLCPGFVNAFNSSEKPANAEMEIGLIDSRTLPSTYGRNVGGISVLTLDRVNKPKRLVRNLRRFNKGKVLATLLPIVGKDDNPSRQNDSSKIMYTPEANCIAPGKDENEDREAVMKYIRKWGYFGDSEVNFDKVGYAVESSGDRQDYELGVFYSL